MSLLKFGEAMEFTQSDFRSVEAIKTDKEIHDRFTKLAANLKKIAPKADDFLYFTAIMMHAAERSTLDEDGNVLKDRHGNDVTAHWDINEKTGSWKWNCSDPNIKSYKNSNGDIFPESELKTAYKKWVGKPLCKDHVSSTVDGVRGLILDTYWDEKYKRIIALCALDKINFPELARNVQTGVSNCVSMGTGVEKSICADCGNVARTEKEYCNHVRGRTCYGEVNVGLIPIELSLVVNGADTRAKIMEVLAAAQQFENNISNHGIDYNQNELSQLREEFAKLAYRVNELENEINSNDNNLALRRTASSANNQDDDLSLVKTQISNVESMLKSIADKFSMEDLMAQKQMSKQGYFNGTEEPVAPGKPQYSKEESDKIRMEDSHMKNPLTDLGPIDGLPKQDLELKKKLLRAAIDERRAVRLAAIEKAQSTIKNAYPNEAPKGGYPVDPGAKIRDTEFEVAKSQGTTGSWGDDEKVKKMLSRASLKARLEKGASVGENKWHVLTENDNKVIFSASFDELASKKPAFYGVVASNDFIRDVMKTIKAHGVDGASKLYKTAEGEPMPAPMPTEPAPALDMPVEGAGGGEVPVAAEVISKLEETSQALTDTIGQITNGASALKEQGADLGGATPSESDTEKALAELTGGAPVNTTASLNVVRKVINAGLSKKFNKNLKRLNAAKSEIDMLIGPAKDGSVNSYLVTNLAKEALATAKALLEKSNILKAGYIQFAKGTFNLEKRAAMENQMKKMAEGTKTPQEVADEAKKTEDAKKSAPKPATTPAPTSTEVKPGEEKKTASGDDLTTPEGRKAYRHKLAASVGTNIKFSDMLNKAHPKPDTTLGGIAGTSEAVVEGIPAVQKQMMDSLSHEPKVKKAAEELNKLIVAGKVNPSDIDEMVKKGLDASVASYWKKMWGGVDGGSEFAAALLKDYSGAKSSTKTAEELDNYKAKYAKAYELAYEMADAGLIAKKSSAIKAEADKIVKFDDSAYESVKRVVAHRSVANVRTASIQPGIAMDNESITSTAGGSNGGGSSFYDELNSLWSTSPVHKRG